MKAALLLIGAVVAGPQGPDALRPDSVLTLPDGPRLVVFSTPGSSVTSIRVSVPLEEPAREAGAARVLQAQALERVSTAANSVGIRVTGTRTPWGIAYTVTGPQSHFEYMAWVLREAVGEPDLDRVRFLRARDQVDGEVEQAVETPHGVVSAQLWNELSPGVPPNTGSHASLQDLTPEAIHDLWASTHDPGQMTIVFAGPGSIPSIIAAFTDLTGSEDAGPPTMDGDGRSLPQQERGRAQVLRRWYGEAWVAGGPQDPHAEVLALMAGRRLGEGGQGYEAGVELWDLKDRRVLTVTGAAYGRNAGAMQTRIRGLLDETRAGLTPDTAERAAAAVRFQMLASARTPEGLVNVVGRYLDASGQPTAARSYLEALDTVTASSLGDFLTRLESGGPVRAEVRP